MKLKNKSILLLTIGTIVCTSSEVFKNNEMDLRNALSKGLKKGNYTVDIAKYVIKDRLSI